MESTLEASDERYALWGEIRHRMTTIMVKYSKLKNNIFFKMICRKLNAFALVPANKINGLTKEYINEIEIMRDALDFTDVDKRKFVLFESIAKFKEIHKRVLSRIAVTLEILQHVIASSLQDEMSEKHHREASDRIEECRALISRADSFPDSKASHLNEEEFDQYFYNFYKLEIHVKKLIIFSFQNKPPSSGRTNIVYKLCHEPNVFWDDSPPTIEEMFGEMLGEVATEEGKTMNIAILSNIETLLLKDLFHRRTRGLLFDTIVRARRRCDELKEEKDFPNFLDSCHRFYKTVGKMAHHFLEEIKEDINLTIRDTMQTKTISETVQKALTKYDKYTKDVITKLIDSNRVD